MKSELLLKNPPQKYSPLAFWFLFGKLKSDKLRWQIRQMVEKGVYGGFMHARAYLETPYLEKAWWEAIDACVDEAKKTGFDAWIYDEYAWPSGTAGSIFTYGLQKPSRVLSEGVRNMGKGLSFRKFASMEELRRMYPNVSLSKDGKNMQLLERIVEQSFREGEQLYCAVPGKDMVYAFYIRVFPQNVDYMNKEAIKKFIESTHEEYRKRYGKEFGKHIPGIFFDEIFMQGSLPWTYVLPEMFEKRFQYDLLKELPCLIEGKTKHAKKVRRDYYQMIGMLYEEAFFQQISEWCTENNLKMTGHTDELLWQHANTQGNYFETMKHLTIPGSDCHDFRYRYPRKITYVEAKYSVAVARAYKKERAMSEALGGAGWNCPLEDFKRGLLTMAALGTGMFILHGFFYECEHQGSQSDWPNSFFYQNPYWKYFKIFSDYIRRLSYVNSIGTPVVHYALYYPIEAMASAMVYGKEDREGELLSNTFHRVLNLMIEKQMDTDLIDGAGIEQAEIKEGQLCIGQQKFSVLLIQEAAEISEAVRRKLMRWHSEGGTILFYRYDKEMAVISPKDVFFNCPVYAPKEIVREAARFKCPDIKLADREEHEVYVNHRSIDEAEIFLICNCSDEKKELRLIFQKTGIMENGKQNLTLYSIETGEGRELSYRIVNEQEILVELVMEAVEGIYLIFSKKASLKPFVPERKYREEVITGAWEFLPFPALPDEELRYNNMEESILEVPVGRVSTDLRKGSELIRICDVNKESGSCGEFISQWSACWITRRPSWANQINAKELFYKKLITIHSSTGKTKFTIATIDSYEVFINGVKIVEGISNGNPVLFTTDRLKEGKNEILIHVINRHPLQEAHVCSGKEIPKECVNTMILEGVIDTKQGKIRIVSDGTWLVTDRYDSMEVIPYYDVTTLKNVNDIKVKHEWIPAWEIGKPPVLPWGDLPLFGRGIRYPQKLYYSIEIPVGTKQIFRPSVEGDAEYLLDGKPIDWEKDTYLLDKNNSRHVLTVVIIAQNGEGGMKSGVRIKVEKSRINLEDWQLMGYTWHSGRAKYSIGVSVPKKAEHCVLDLGKVHFCAEVWVNGKLAGVRLWSPYRLDITNFLREGENQLDIIVSNLEGNERRYMLVKEGRAMGWNRYWYEENLNRDASNYVSGLLGPVKILYSL